ncbi:4-hydroxy-tetrahydrodipicolinate synthase [Siminovitchia fortis]|uniref:4-hydroxy-tetrahydrodipicolinate synthase n=1 Tax=Siminovitchia fortis TaxID=254758 RepID=A0A443IV27_9BACI|nr:4-hydroxy-tetrahydrodipicolinate synthase [Siminovitchia fortis]RWR11933.1 4-hydroxy-tetrahydrodipicolinate synthase [Siminovitchia fortis]WHY80807.1 4-hydroxy-tetrahydrodipicolinate synthase [Siminovitchia fortis]
MTNLKGVYPVLVTPMHNDETVNWDGLKNNIEYFINQGVDGLAINGSTGEFVSLTKEERFKAVEEAVKQVAGRIPLIVGTAAETTEEAIEYTQQAEKAGADAALLINSYYAHPKEEEIYEHFKAVAESVSFPIMIYNNPFTSGVNISVETILRTGRDVENITHVKESSGEIRNVRDISRQGKGFIKTFCGADDMVLESFTVGAEGWISVAGNIAPRTSKEMYDAYVEGDISRAWELYDKLLPLCNFLEGSGKYVQITKHAMDLKGLAGGPARRPRLGLSHEEQETLKKLMEQLDVLEVSR